jgi:hypothetical protein
MADVSDEVIDQVLAAPAARALVADILRASGLEVAFDELSPAEKRAAVAAALASLPPAPSGATDALQRALLDRGAYP